MKVMIFWTSYLWFPFVVLCLMAVLRRKGGWRRFAVFALLASLPLAWARFVEPQLLFTHEVAIDLSGDAEPGQTIKIALFADTHFGVFGNAMPMRRIVEQVNTEGVDAVFIAGDFLYELPADKIAASLAALSQLEAPVYAVTGNHDVGFPGPDYGSSLYVALRELDVTLLENRAFEIEIVGQRVVVAGASDLWQGRQSFGYSTDLPKGVPVLLLTHNPDTALSVPKEFQYDLMLAGHTHGGQIRIPGMVRRVIPTQYPFDMGLHTMPDGRRVYVTPGTGMVGLPMRFRRPPRIDVLTLTLPAR